MSQGSDGLNFFKIEIFTRFLSIQKIENIFLHPMFMIASIILAWYSVLQVSAHSTA